MALKSAKSGRKSAFEFGEASPDPTPVQLEQRRMAALDEGVSISLKYYRVESECFSEWKANELKRFSMTIEKMRRMSFSELRAHTALCSKHLNQTKTKRFSRPDAIGKDVPLYEIRVGQHDKARIHGFLIGSVFHLCWLDRRHEVFPG